MTASEYRTRWSDATPAIRRQRIDAVSLDIDAAAEHAREKQHGATDAPATRWEVHTSHIHRDTVAQRQ